MLVLEVPVDQVHIDKGEAGSSILCPIAWALLEKGIRYASVGTGRTTIYPIGYRKGKGVPFLHDEETTAWIRSLDNGEPVAPFTARMVLNAS